MTISGTLVPKACTRRGFSVAARSVEPSRVCSMRNQVVKHTTSEARMTQAR